MPQRAKPENVYIKIAQSLGQLFHDGADAPYHETIEKAAHQIKADFSEIAGIRGVPPEQRRAMWLYFAGQAITGAAHQAPNVEDIATTIAVAKLYADGMMEALNGRELKR